MTTSETGALQAKWQMHFSLPFFNTDIAFGEQLTFPHWRAQQMCNSHSVSSFGNKIKRAKTHTQKKANNAFYFGAFLE